MINILDVQDKLKSLSQQQLTQEMQSPSGAVPQYLVLSEISRRQAMQQSMQQQNAGKQTVAQELLSGAGVPAEGMSDMAQSMAPKSSIAQNTGISALPQEAPPPEQGGIAALAPQQPTGMYAGGPVRKMYEGRTTSSDPYNDRRNAIIENRKRVYGAVGNTAGGIADMFDRYAYGAPLAALSYGSSLADSGISSIAGLIPGGEDVSIYFADQAKGTMDDAGNLREHGLFPDLYTAPPEATPSAPSVVPDSSGSKTRHAEDVAAMNAPQKPVDNQNQDTSAGGSGGAGGSGAGGGGGKQSTYEQMLADAMANADKKAKQDKWLALAQAGMALMSSTQPNLAGALGEAGTAGIAALQNARDTAEKTKLQLAQEQYGIEERKAALARAAASAGSTKPRTASSVLKDISSIDEILSNMQQKDMMGEVLPPDKATAATMADLMTQRDELIRLYSQLQASGVDLSDSSQ